MSAFMRLIVYHRHQTRSYSVRGTVAQDACVITLLKSLWLIQPSSFSVLSSRGGRSSGKIRYLSSSVWRGPSMSTNASVESVEAQTIDQVWEEYFADPLQWCDDRIYKVANR